MQWLHMCSGCRPSVCVYLEAAEDCQGLLLSSKDSCELTDCCSEVECCPERCLRSCGAVRCGLLPADGVLSDVVECCLSSRSAVRAHRVLSELTECCASSRSAVSAHVVRSELMECCPSSRRLVGAVFLVEVTIEFGRVCWLSNRLLSIA